MTTPAPEKSSARARRHKTAEDHRPRLKMSFYGWLVAWLTPNILMAGLVVILNLLPVAEKVGDLTPILTLVGLSGLFLGAPLSLLANWLFRFQLNHSVHVMAYALIGMLYGLTVLTAGASGLVPLLIPLVGFPAAILMALGRWAASPFVAVIDPDGEPVDEMDADMVEAADYPEHPGAR